MRKAYSNRKPVEQRPGSDFYTTPAYLIEELVYSDEFKVVIELIAAYELVQEHHKILGKNNIKILDLACGNGIFGKVLKEHLPKAFPDFTFEIIEHDIRKDGVDFLSFESKNEFDIVITNPPFSLFDEFVTKAKEVAPFVIFIGKTNFFGAYNRYKKGIWNHLEFVSVFNRQVDYRSSVREDGKFQCGNLVTGWFFWNRNWKSNYWETSIMDVQNGVVNKKDIDKIK